MLKIVYLLVFCITTILTIYIPSHSVYANSGLPPSIIVIVQNAPKDLSIKIGEIKGYRTNKLFESYYIFYSTDLVSDANYTLSISTGDNSFDIRINTPLKSYNNLFVLDVKKQTLESGRSVTRSLASIFTLLLFTLIIEGIVLLLFGIRKKYSWIIFLVVNIITQGILYIWLNGFYPIYDYIIYPLLIGEILILIVEIITFLTLVSEHSHLRIFLYVLTANISSLALGYILITYLPI